MNQGIVVLIVSITVKEHDDGFIAFIIVQSINTAK